jgi:hypothetical protein
MRCAALVVACSLALVGCGSFSTTDWLPSMSLGSGVGLRLESDPPGAEAQISAGPACRTPCTVSVPARDEMTVTFNLAGYLPQTIPVRLQGGSPGTDSAFASVAELAPNPVFAQLEPVPPPVAKKKAKPKPRTAKAPAASRSGPSSGETPAAQRTIPGAQPTVPPAQRQIPGSQPTAPPASAWPPPR